MKILLLGDLHIGSVGSRGREPEIETAVKHLAEQAKISKVSHVVIAGDLFDTFRYPGRNEIIFASKIVDKLLGISPKVNVSIVCGNHDWLDLDIWEVLSGSNRIRVYREPERVMLRDGRDSVELFTFPHMRKHQLAKGFEFVSGESYGSDGASGGGLFVAHMAYENTVPHIKEPMITPENLAFLRSKYNVGFAYFGHIHMHGEISGTPIPARYTGTVWRTTFSEENNAIGGYILDASYDVPWTDMDIELDGRKLRTLEYGSIEEMQASVLKDVKSAKKRCGDPIIRVLVDGDCVKRALSDSLREVLPSDELALVSKVDIRRPDNDRSAVRDTGSSVDGSPLSIESLWKEYSAGEDPRIGDAGIAVLGGATPETVLSIFDATTDRHMIETEEEEFGGIVR